MPAMQVQQAASPLADLSLNDLEDHIRECESYLSQESRLFPDTITVVKKSQAKPTLATSITAPKIPNQLQSATPSPPPPVSSFSFSSSSSPQRMTCSSESAPGSSSISPPISPAASVASTASEKSLKENATVPFSNQAALFSSTDYTQSSSNQVAHTPVGEFPAKSRYMGTPTLGGYTPSAPSASQLNNTQTQRTSHLLQQRQQHLHQQLDQRPNMLRPSVRSLSAFGAGLSGVGSKGKHEETWGGRGGGSSFRSKAERDIVIAQLLKVPSFTHTHSHLASLISFLKFFP